MYPSDITERQFEKIRPILESARKRTRPRVIDLLDAFNAVLYVVNTGCQWRSLPKDYPKWKTAHKYFGIWSTTKTDGETILARVLKKIGRGRTYEKWQRSLNDHGYRRCAEREEYRHGAGERL